MLRGRRYRDASHLVHPKPRVRLCADGLNQLDLAFAATQLSGISGFPIWDVTNGEASQALVVSSVKSQGNPRLRHLLLISAEVGAIA